MTQSVEDYNQVTNYSSAYCSEDKEIKRNKEHVLVAYCRLILTGLCYTVIF